MAGAESDDENFVERSLLLLVGVVARARLFHCRVVFLWHKWLLEGSENSNLAPGFNF